MGQERFSIPAPTRHKLTVDEFLALDDAGFFEGKGRFELIEGEIYTMSPILARHARVLMLIGYEIEHAVRAARLELAMLSPASLRLGAHSLPEPDLMLVKTPIVGDFVDPAATLLAIEVSQSSLRHDLKRKAGLYAAHAIPEYWVVDLKGCEVHQMTDPMAKGYATVEVHSFGARVTSKAVPQIALDTARLA